MSTDPRIEAAAKALNAAGWTCYEGNDEPGNYGTCEDCTRHCDELATTALAAANKAATITTVEELDALPVGTVVLAHWEDHSQPDYHAMKCRDGGASSSGFGVSSGRHWTGMASWGATLTVLHFGGSK